MAEIDLELRITLRDERTLAFELTSQRFGYYRTAVGQTLLTVAPRQHLDLLFNDLSQLARRSGAGYSAQDQSEVSTRIAAFGQVLYRDLIPEELKRAYRRIRRHQAGPLSLLITSDEPWIPWELVRPFERDTPAEQGFDDPFFCEQFALTRWLAGGSLPQQLEVKTIALVAPKSGLSYVQRERAYIDGLAQRAPQARILPPIGTASAVRAGLRDRIAQLWHIATHGNFAGSTPDRSAVQLDGGELRAEEIVGPVEQGIAHAQPLVLLNACHTGRQDFALTGLGGWAQQLVRAGASAFVGTQWEAHDALAAEFAVALYEALWSGQTLGQAAHTARQAIKSQDPTNPTWLAYAVYGHPDLRVWLAGQTGPEQTAAPPVDLRPLPPDASQATSAPATTNTRSVQPAPVAPAIQPADDFVYDAFVSYLDADPDRAWVEDELVPTLVASGLRICLDRDLVYGAAQVTEMERAVTESRRTIAVLSTQYLAGNFQDVQNVMAQTLGIEEGQYRLLPLIFEPNVALPLRIRMLKPLTRSDLERQPQTWQRLITAIRTLPKRR
ncbi:MAG TPA: CHAT domain-containing protein [Herpetosiphonaceae bacterium]